MLPGAGCLWSELSLAGHAELPSAARIIFVQRARHQSCRCTSCQPPLLAAYARHMECTRAIRHAGRAGGRVPQPSQAHPRKARIHLPGEIMNRDEALALVREYVQNE